MATIKGAISLETEIIGDPNEPCAHKEAWEEIGQTVEGTVIFCHDCGCSFNDIKRPKIYTPRENEEWWLLYRDALTAVRYNKACFLKGGHHSPCMACRDYRDAERDKMNARIRASTVR